MATNTIRVPWPGTDRAFVHEFLGRQELRCGNREDRAQEDCAGRAMDGDLCGSSDSAGDPRWLRDLRGRRLLRRLGKPPHRGMSGIELQDSLASQTWNALLRLRNQCSECLILVSKLAPMNVVGGDSRLLPSHS